MHTENERTSVKRMNTEGRPGLRVLLEDRRLAARLGQAARDRALSRFSGQRYLDEYDALYRQVGS
jgi:hypothetical protein